MKKVIFLFILLAFAFTLTSTSYAGIWVSDFPYSPDYSVTYDRYSWDGWNHTVVNYNDTAFTAVQIIMDPDGYPWLYYWGDFDYWARVVYIYYSYDGYNWYYWGWTYF
jgi:hypothetical protein